MYDPESQTEAFLRLGPEEVNRFSSPSRLIGDEFNWRVRPTAAASSKLAVVATRWRTGTRRIVKGQVKEVSAEAAKDFHVVGIVLRRMDVRLSVAGKTVLDGVAMPGTLHVTPPNALARCLFRGTYDALHLYLPDDLISECTHHTGGYPTTTSHSLDGLSRDVPAARLCLTLMEAQGMGHPFGQMFLDSLSVAIVARLLTSTTRAVPSNPPAATGLAQWRLKRATDYVESRLAGPVSLADVASASGLTRMHFAAQFKAATGFRPHEYLLRRRVERAQEMLLEPDVSVVDTALSVGFQTQAHFTTVFKRFAGLSPHAWRQAHTSVV